MNRALVLVSVLSLLAACGDDSTFVSGADSGVKPDGAVSGGSDSGAQSGKDSGTKNDGDGSTPANGPACPYTLTQLTEPPTSTADISLYFSVFDANDEPVTGLTVDDFVATEDGDAVDKLESDFSVVPLEGETLDIPTVLVLDLSGSIVNGGALETLKDAGKAMVDAMLPEQRMALITFADNPTLRTSFTTDKTALKAAIDALDGSEGASTNLHGALIQALSMWNDGFQNDPTFTRLTVGLAVVITDGADTAKVNTIDEVITSRGDKRIVSVGVGPGVDKDKLEQIGNAGSITSASYDALKKDIGKVTAAVQRLGKSIYRANYCTPTRANQHQLVFKALCGGDTAPGASDTTDKCLPVNVSILNTCNERGELACSNESCCPAGMPFECGNGDCYATQEEALAVCNPCGICQGAEIPVDNSGSSGSPQIDVDFNATGFNSKQCPAFWGAKCKDLKTCCGTLTTDNATSCVQSLNTALGDETQCTSYETSYCPTLGTECKKLDKCCDKFGTTSQTTCQQQLFSVHGAEVSCMSYQSSYCPTTPSCVAFAKCCAAKSDTETAGEGSSPRAQCEQALISSGNIDSSCTSYMSSYACE